MFAQVAVPIPCENCVLDYLLPPDMEAQLLVGMRVRVPLGRRMATGFCVGLRSESPVPPEKMRKINAVVDQHVVLGSRMLEFARWWARYYHCSLGEALATSVPSAVGNPVKPRQTCLVRLASTSAWQEQMAELEQKKPQQWRVLRFLQECAEPVSRDNLCQKLKISPSPIMTLARQGFVEMVAETRVSDPFATLPLKQVEPPLLNQDQEAALARLLPKIEAREFYTFLLFGVTGSGKTEVYIRAIEATVRQGREALVLVPEIALTPQTVIRFKERFPHVAVLHSELTPSQRAHQWEEIHMGKIQVVIGARSALFAPTHNLGLIVVDEEHEPTFKQQNSPRYHARDMAVKRAQLENAVVILGSATPSLESYQNALSGKYELCRLPSRIGQMPLPQVSLVDMKEECRIHKRFVYFSRFLMQQLEKVLANREQAILFLNRRGFATTVICPVCGYFAHCPHCDVSLTYHHKGQKLSCHYCGYEKNAPSRCPECQFTGIRMLGAGTERVEAILRKSFPEARVARMDSDNMTSRKKYEETFLAFASGELDILLGTQMIAKGLDFPRVTLVGIVTADTSLQLPDFRAAERTFQLLVQVAGRAGRGEKQGKVILQTFHSEHYAIMAAFKQDYEKFAAQELSLRRELNYPPFGRLVRIVVEGKEEVKVLAELRDIMRLLKSALPSEVEILGPAAAPIARIEDRLRWHIILKSLNFAALARGAALVQPRLQGQGTVRVLLDQDPVSLL
jgi:primosomal protein N' (replication factor Y)